MARWNEASLSKSITPYVSLYLLLDTRPLGVYEQANNGTKLKNYGITIFK